MSLKTSLLLTKFLILSLLFSVRPNWAQTPEPAKRMRQVFLRAVEDLKRRHYENAGQGFREILQVYPNNLKAHFYLGIALYHSHELKEAEAQFRWTARHSREMTINHYYLARVLFDTERLEESMKELKEANRLNPRISMVHYYEGLIHYSKKDFASARNEFKKAVREEPSLSRARYALAYLYYNRFHDSTAAFVQIQKGLKGNADSLMRAKLLKLRGEMVGNRAKGK